MENLVSKIQETFDGFAKDANAQIEKGNKAAGTRARKASLELEKLMKEFRKNSLELSKK
jgi:Histone H1-like protein Hc1.